MCPWTRAPGKVSSAREFFLVPCGASVVPGICFWPLSLRPNPLEPEVCAEGLATCWAVGVGVEPCSLPGGTDDPGYAWARKGPVCNCFRKRSLGGRGAHSWEKRGEVRRGGRSGDGLPGAGEEEKERGGPTSPPTSGAAETNDPATQGEGHLLVSTGWLCQIAEFSNDLPMFSVWGISHPDDWLLSAVPGGVPPTDLPQACPPPPCGLASP